MKQAEGGRWELYSPEASAFQGFSKDPVRGLLAPDGPGHGLGRSALTAGAPEARIWAAREVGLRGRDLTPGAGPRGKGWGLVAGASSGARPAGGWEAEQPRREAEAGRLALP